MSYCKLVFINKGENMELKEGSVWNCGNIPDIWGRRQEFFSSNHTYLSHPYLMTCNQGGVVGHPQVLHFPTLIHSHSALISFVLHGAMKEESWCFALWCFWHTRNRAAIVLSEYLLDEWRNNCHLRPWWLNVAS